MHVDPEGDPRGDPSGLVRRPDAVDHERRTHEIHHQSRLRAQTDDAPHGHPCVEQRTGAERTYADYRQMLEKERPQIVSVAPRWLDGHRDMVMACAEYGAHVFLEKPMCHTIDEAKKLVDTVRETKRVLQVGSQTTSGDQWSKARKAIQDGMIGDVLLSQGSYHRNSKEGEWNWPIDKEAGPEGKGDNYIDWKMWLGPAQKRNWDPDRFFRFRKYWDYSGGIATDLFYHVVAPMNICWGEPQFPYKVVADGGIFVFKKA